MLFMDSIPEPYVLFVSPSRYTKLLSVVERTLMYLGPEDGVHSFMLWETLALRIKDSRGIYGSSIIHAYLTT
jgi:hypothetical protein